MKKFLNFLQYHNFMPLVLLFLTMGAGSAWAMTAEWGGGEAAALDAALLLETDIDRFDFSATVTNIAETETQYLVSYSLRTLSPEGSRWAEADKTGEFSIAKSSLDETGLEGAVVAKLRDIESAERTYLTRVQATERALAEERAARPSNLFSSLIGKQADQIDVPEPERPYFDLPEEAEEESPTEEDSAFAGSSTPESVDAGAAASSTPVEEASSTAPTTDPATTTESVTTDPEPAPETAPATEVSSSTSPVQEPAS